MRVSPRQLARIIKKEKDNSQLKQLLRHIFSFSENIDTFSQFFFPEAITTTIPNFHKEIYKELFTSGNSAFAAPRGHGKSTITGLVFVIFNIVNKIDKYIVYISQNHTKTVQFLDPVRFQFKENERLNFVYESLSLESSKDEYGKDREDCFDIGGIRVQAASFEKNIRGFKYGNSRPTLIIGDDIESDERVMNPELRKKDEDKLNKVIIPSLDVKGRFKFIGTILHIESLLKKKINQYKGKIYSSCDREFKNVLMPELYSKKKLEEVYEEIGSVCFEQEYLNNPIDNVASLIKREWIEKCLRTDISFDDLNTKLDSFSFKVMGADFAFSDRISADDSAYTSLGIKDKLIYLIHAEKTHGQSINEQMKHIKNPLFAKYKYDQIGLEENSIKAVSKDLHKYHMPIKLFWTGSHDEADKKPGYTPDFTGKRRTVGKINLILRLATAFETKRFILPYKTKADRVIVDRLIAECTSFALSNGKLVEAGIHPDYPIALGYALELIDNYKKLIINFG